MSTKTVTPADTAPIPPWGWRPSNANHNDHPQVWSFFVACSIVLLAVGVVIPLVVHDGPMLWPLAVMGAIIIVSLLSAAAVPHLRQH